MSQLHQYGREKGKGKVLVIDGKEDVIKLTKNTSPSLTDSPSALTKLVKVWWDRI